MIRKIINLLFYVIAAFYIFLMIDLLFRFNVIFDTHRIISGSYNLIPFKTIWDYASGNYHVSKSFAADNILGNMVVFIPYGLYLQVIQKRKAFAKSLLIVIITSIAIEMIQFAFGLGASDIDDVILNCCGGIIGILVYKLLRKVFKEETRTKTAITVISLVIGIPIIYIYFTTVFNHLSL
jgi:glycopeptide antibiotics resistance protein